MHELLTRVPRRYLSLARAVLPLAGGILFFVLWTVAEAGRSPHGLKELMFLLWAAALAAAGARPRIALAATVGIPALMAAVGAASRSLSVFPDFGYHHTLDWHLSLSTSWPAWLAAPIIVGYVAATRPGWRVRVTALIVGAISAVGYAALLMASGWIAWIGGSDNLYGITHSGASLALGTLATVAIAWLLGIGLAALWDVRIVADRLETTAAQLDETDLELRLAHDRGRISRDIHDSLAHSLAIIVAQAEGAAAIHPLKPDAAPESLANIATVARHALGEVRRLVERINEDEDELSEHTSRLDDLPALVEEVRGAGVDASLRLLGRVGPLTLSKQVAVYRIVQESLTNALKHGGRGTTATVTLDAQGAGLAVLVVSVVGGGAPLVSDGAGRGIGIAGMKERARLVGGWLTAIPSDDDTFIVTAFIPPDSDAVEPAPESDDLVDADSKTAELAIEGVARG